MASLKECKARAKKIGQTVVRIPEKHRTYAKGYRFRVNHSYARNVADLSKLITIETRQKKREEFYKLNGYRLKGGYKMVKRKR